MEIKRKRPRVVHATVGLDKNNRDYRLRLRISYYTYIQLTVDSRVSFHEYFEIILSETARRRRRGSRTDKPVVQLTFFQAQ